jgi:hypothetical protein
LQLNQAAPISGTPGPPERPNGVADGAHDRYLSLSLGVRLRLLRSVP